MSPSRLYAIGASCLGLALSQAAYALPASARLFHQNYGYKVSCLLCHSSGGGSSPNNYGKAFLRAGGNSAAFKKIESPDSDGDGIPNLAEILAKSNPGDKHSNPTKTGDWLVSASSIFIPKDQLEKLFPDYSNFSAIEGSLSPKQLEFVQSKIGRPPPDDDKVPTFYFAEKDGKRQAVAQLMTEQKDSKGISTGVAVATNGKILRVVVLGGTLGDTTKDKKELTDPYVGKSLLDLPSALAGDASKLIDSSVRRSLALMQAVFGGGAK